MNTKIALITGATSGIGKATAKLLAQNGYDIIITGRREKRLTELQKKIEIDYRVQCHPLCFDIREQQQTEESLNSLSNQWKKVDVLVNNAGLAVGLNTIQNGIVDDWERMIDTNVKGLLYVTRIVSNWMIQHKTGHIINISSIAGKETYPYGNVYCASKHAVQSLTKAMRIDLLEHNIKVSSVCPGAVETEFSLVRFKNDKKQADNVYKGYQPLSATDIAETILFMVTRPPHVNIDDVLIMPTSQAFSRDFNKTKS